MKKWISDIMTKIDTKKPAVTDKGITGSENYTHAEIQKEVLKFAVPQGDLKNNLNRLSHTLLPKLLHGTTEEMKKALAESNDLVVEVMLALETDTHTALMGTFNAEYRGLAKELSEQIIKEHGLVSSTEKILAELIANSFIRVIDNSRRLNNELECREITPNKNVYISLLSKQVDRANRQFLSALLTLKQLKSPTIEMNIKTKNTFVAQNQQVNTNDVFESDKQQNNESK